MTPAKRAKHMETGFGPALFPRVHSGIARNARASAHRAQPWSAWLAGACSLLVASLLWAQERPIAPFEVVRDGIPQSLAAVPGSAERGRALLVERAAANCLLCHAIPDPSIRVAGDVGPSLAGVGRRLSAAQLRLRVADIQRVNRDAAMPSYYRVDALDRVAGDYRDKPVLDGQQVEDLVAYLQTLK